MSVRKCSDGTWEAYAYYKDILTKKNKKKHKRGFPTKRAAKAWERDFLAGEAGSPETKLSTVYDKYLAYIKTKVKGTTIGTKTNIFEKHILPRLGDFKIGEIDEAVLDEWYKEMNEATTKTGKRYEKTYIRTVENQLSAILNYAVRKKYIATNPIKVAGRGTPKSSPETIDFWTQDEFESFVEEVMDKPLSHAIFEMFFWTGIREGEALALTPQDFSEDKDTGIWYVKIDKNWQRIDGKWQNTTPKTKKSYRSVPIPEDTVDEVLEYMRLFNFGKDQRIFPVTKGYLYHEMNRGCEASGVKRIRIHDLRHSYASMLIQENFSVLEIASLMGHEAIEVTLRYGHLMHNANDAVVKRLNERQARSVEGV